MSSTTTTLPTTTTVIHHPHHLITAPRSAPDNSKDNNDEDKKKKEKKKTCSNSETILPARGKPGTSTSMSMSMSTSTSSSSSIDSRFETMLSKRDGRSARRRLTLARPGVADFSSNDFLSLAASPLLRDAYLCEFTSPATSALALGSGGSRLLDGNSPYAESLERDIAAFHGAPAGLLFNSGFDANAGIFSCVPQQDDVVVYDEFIHASVHEGMRLSRAFLAQQARSSSSSSSSSSTSTSGNSSHERRGGGRGGCYAFRHNDLAHFEQLLATLTSSSSSSTTTTSNQPSIAQDPSRHVFVAVETVYSMDGDVAPLAQLLALIDKYLPLGNGHLIVDEAHSTGVYGEFGRGVVCALGLEQRVFARLHTFGKALSSSGAIVLCSPLLREYLVNYARSLIYTSMMGLPSLAGIRAVYGLLMSGQTTSLQANLWSSVSYLHKSLLTTLGISNNSDDDDDHDDDDHLATAAAEGVSIAEEKESIRIGEESSSSSRERKRRKKGEERRNILTVSTAKPTSPIFSLLTAYPRKLAARCQERGYMARPIVAPTVPVGAERVRVCLHAGNTRAEIAGLVEVIAEWVDEQDQDQDQDRERERERERDQQEEKLKKQQQQQQTRKNAAATAAPTIANNRISSKL